MQLEGWKLFAAALATGTLAGALFWLLARTAAWFTQIFPQRLPFANDLLGSSGDHDRRRYRVAGRELAILFAALLVVVLAGVLAALAFSGLAFPALPAWGFGVAALLAVAVLAAAGYCIARLVMARRRLRFGWAARTAIGNVLKRLNFSGNRVFHDVKIEGARIDHVVVGEKGVFAVNVVARRLPRQVDGRAAVELRNGKLWMAGTVEALPVGDAARNMTLLTAALGRVVGHRVPVRSVLAVPGWHTVPNGSGNHLVLNENNLAMLTSWNTPEAYLMEEDCVEIQNFLARANRVRRLD